jgi:tetratricopeptide (TPR) repeat protein
VVTKKDKYLAAAQKFLEKGSLDKALAEFSRAVQEDPKDTRTWLRIAEIHVKRGDNEKATEVYLRTADLYVEQGFFQRAVAVYKNIIKLTPGYSEAYLKLADIFKQLGLLSDAMQQFELAAGVFQRAGKTKEAMAAMRQIVDLNPEQPVARIKLAEAASQSGLIDEAVAEFQRAAELLKAQGRVDEYLRVTERLLFHRPENAALAKSVARLYIERNNARFALAKLQACFKVDPRDTETLDLLARAFEQLGQVPKTISVLKELAKVLGDTGRGQDRVATFKRIAALDPGDNEAQSVLATRASYVPEAPKPRPSMPVPERPRAAPREATITFSEMQVPQFLQQKEEEPGAPVAFAEEAKSTSERVAIATNLLEPSVDETVAEVQRIITESDVFVKYGLIDRAAEHLRKVFEMNPTHVGAHERLAAVLQQLGRNGEAVSELELLGEQLALSEPALAADFARKALAIDASAARARRVLEKLAPSRGAVAEEELEDVSGDIIEMSTPEPELVGNAAIDFEGEDTDKGHSAISQREGTASDLLPVADAFTASDDGDLPPDLDSTDQGSFSEVEPTPADNPLYHAMASDLEQVDFFLQQGLPEDARFLLDDMSNKYPRSPLMDDRRARLRDLDEAAANSGLGAVPVANLGTQSSQPAVGITPKAVVSGGGEMDLAAHRDLGIGYKDMGLFDAAIGEFTQLTRDPTQEVFALGMIGECHECKGALGDAVAYYKKALNRPAISDSEATQLYYQLGSVFQTMGEVNEALYFFEKVLKREAGFRDARRRIADLRGQQQASVAAGGVGAKTRR